MLRVNVETPFLRFDGQNIRKYLNYNNKKRGDNMTIKKTSLKEYH